jgi:hypothetical protein
MMTLSTVLSKVNVFLIFFCCTVTTILGTTTRSYIAPISNEYISNMIWAFRNVSYKNNILYVHNMNKRDIKHITAPMRNKAIAGAYLKGEVPWPKPAFPFRSIQLLHTDLNLSECATVETRRVTFARFTDPGNCYSCNQGHFVINILNPLLLHLYFVLQNRASVHDVALQQISLPIQNSLLLFDGDIHGRRPPVYLFDFVLSLMDSVQPTKDYLRDDGNIHCFAHLDMPVLERGAYWDKMYHTLQGRWGSKDFYFNFWRKSKKLIWTHYRVQHIISNSNSNTTSSNKRSREHHSLGRLESSSIKPTLLWALRESTGDSRADGNLNLISEVMSRHFNFQFLTKSDFQWFGGGNTKSQLRYPQAQKVLKKIYDADIMVGFDDSQLIT